MAKKALMGMFSVPSGFNSVPEYVLSSLGLDSYRYSYVSSTSAKYEKRNMP